VRSKELEDFIMHAMTPVPGQRLGQSFMSKLWEANRLIYAEIASTASDPFYVDGRLMLAIQAVVDNWDRLKHGRTSAALTRSTT
jgi:hypothetical protein